jgi:hypothetical protein
MSEHMEATYDLVCHPIACPRCGTVAQDPCAIDLQTKIFAHKQVRSLRIGDTVELDPDPVWNWGYFRLSTGTHTGRARVLETWTCPSCAANFVWALLSIDDGVLRDVRPVELTDAVLRSADYISSQVQFLFPSGDHERLRALPLDQLRAEIAAAARS